MSQCNSVTCRNLTDRSISAYDNVGPAARNPQLAPHPKSRSTHLLSHLLSFLPSLLPSFLTSFLPSLVRKFYLTTQLWLAVNFFLFPNLTASNQRSDRTTDRSINNRQSIENSAVSTYIFNITVIIRKKNEIKHVWYKEYNRNWIFQACVMEPKGPCILVNLITTFGD